MSDSKRLIVLESQDQVNQLKDVIEYIALSKPELELRVLNRQESSTVIYYLVKELVDGKLAFKEGDETNSNAITAILFGVPVNKITSKHIKAYQLLVDEPSWFSVSYALDAQIKNVIKPSDWTEWQVVKVGSLIALAEGQDYRITEFHKESAALSDDDEAIVTLNCLNPINYIYHQFVKQYAGNIEHLKRALANPHNEISTLCRNTFIQFLNDPADYISGLFLDTLVEMQPQMELACTTLGHKTFIDTSLNIFDITAFKSNVVSKVITAFVMGSCKHRLKNDESYVVEYYPNTHVIAVFKKQFSMISEQYEADLLNAFRRGDFLPEHERVIAERIAINS